MNDPEGYWEKWQKLIEAAAEFQKIFPEGTIIGGSAAALHAGHRYSFDVDFAFSDLKNRYEEVLDFLEGRDDWATARLSPPKLILGNFKGIETGLRQLRRPSPLETQTIKIGGYEITLPTPPEVLRTKGWMILCRNAVRDYLDFAAISCFLGEDNAVEGLLDFDRYYQNMGKTAASGLLQLIRQLSDPRPGDLDAVDLKKYKGVRPPFDSWDVISSVCKKVATGLTLSLSSEQG
jgi:hypothetical protein